MFELGRASERRSPFFSPVGAAKKEDTMKVMIRCDMEGLTNIVRFDQCEPGGSEYEYARRMLMSDLNAVVAGLARGGADEIWVYDMHWDGRNVVKEELAAPAKLIAGKPRYEPRNAGGLDSTYDGMCLVGLHAKAGTPGALLAHSYEHETQDVRVNGVSMGEIGLEAAIAGDFDVPLILVAADSAGAREAEATIPGVTTVAVKEGTGLEQGECYPAEQTRLLLEAGAARAAAEAARVRPYKFEPPIELEIDLAASDLRERIRNRCPEAFVSDATVRLQGKSVTDAWSQYLVLKAEA